MNVRLEMEYRNQIYTALGEVDLKGVDITIKMSKEQIGTLT